MPTQNKAHEDTRLSTCLSCGWFGQAKDTKKSYRKFAVSDSQGKFMDWDIEPTCVCPRCSKDDIAIEGE